MTRSVLRFSPAAAAAALTLFLSGGTAHAQTASGFALDRFDPAERGSDWFANESLDLRGHLRPALGLVIDGAYRPLVVYNADDSVRSSIVRNQVIGHVGGSLVLWNRLRVGVNAPIAIFQDGHTGTLNGITYASPDTPSFGDVRVGGDVRLLGEYGSVFTLAAGAQLFLPTGARGGFTGDGSVRVQPRVAAAGDVGPFTYAARVAVQYRGLDDGIGSTKLGSEMTFGAAAGLRALDRRLTIGPELFGSTVITGDQVFAARSTPVEGLLGAHLQLAKDWKLGAGLGAGLTRGLGAPVYRVLASVEWAPAFEAAPPPVLDRDGDGIPDDRDACPDVKGVPTDDPKTNGCPPPPPPPPPPADRDGDGVLDKDDACPDVAGEKTSDPATNGCPAPKDSDGDGVLDKDDACPTVPGLKTEDPKTNGCPDPDRDKDTVLNDVDACPDEPGAPDPDPKRNGCPKAFIQGGQIKILDQVRFATSSAAIVPGKDSEDVLNAVLKVLKDHPEIVKIQVEGHTDNQGAAGYNRTLSANRAASVVTWLVKHGIVKDRLSSAGFGPDRPLSANDTAEGRTANRRVEFHIQEGK
jgi:OmpA-OmpF porin, OOP family